MNTAAVFLNASQELYTMIYRPTFTLGVFFVFKTPNQSGTIGTLKWEPRAHTGVYLGHSPCHTSSDVLVLYLRTWLVSPRFRLVFDDEFSTVPYLDSTNE